MRMVLDAGVVAKCLLVEPGSDQAKALMLQWAEGSLDLLAPDVLAVEIASMLWKRAVRGQLPADTALLLYHEFQELRIPVWPCERLADPALQLALQYQRPVYKCLYVALAATTESRLVTADEVLWQTFNPVFPGIRLLRDCR